MADERQDLLLEIQSNASNAVTDLQRLTDSLSKLGGETTKAKTGAKELSEGFSKAQANVVTLDSALNLLRRTYSALAGPIRDVIAEAVKEERAISQLNAALKAADQYTAGYSQRLVQLAESLSKVSRHESDVILGVERQLVRFGAGSEQIERLTKATLDLAVGMGRGLPPAVFAMGRALEGEFSGLKRFNIAVDEGASRSKQLEQALAGITQRFGGAAAAELGRYSQNVNQLEKAWGDLQKAVGKAIIENDLVNDSLQETTGFLTDITPRVGEMARGWMNAAGALKDFTVHSATAFAQVAQYVPVFRELVGLLKLFGTAYELSFGQFEPLPAAPGEAGAGGAPPPPRPRRGSQRDTKAAASAAIDLAEAQTVAAENQLNLYQQVLTIRQDQKANDEELLALARAIDAAEVQLIQRQVAALEVQREQKDTTAAQKELIDAQIVGLQQQIELQQLAGGQTQKLVNELNEKALDQEKARADLLREVAQLEAEAFGTPQQERIQGLQNEQARLIEQLGELGLTGEIERVRAAYDEFIDEAQAGTIDLGATINTAIGDAFSGVILNTRDAGDVLEGFTASFKKQFAQAFSEALQEKAGFDEKWNVNFLRDLPDAAAKGATSTGNIFSNLFGFLGGGVGGGPVSITAGGITGSTGIATDVFGQPQGGYSIDTSTLAGQLEAGATGPQSVAGGIPTGGGGAPGLSLLGAAGPYGAAAAAAIQIIDGAIKAANQQKWKLGQSWKDIALAAGEGGFGKTLATILGTKQGLQASQGEFPLIGEIPVVSDILNATAGRIMRELFQPKTPGAIIKKQIDKVWENKAGLPEVQWLAGGGQKGLRTQFFEAPLFERDIGRFEDLLNIDLPAFTDSLELGGHGRGGDSRDKLRRLGYSDADIQGIFAAAPPNENRKLYEQLTAGGVQQDVSDLRFGPTFALSQVMFGSAKGTPDQKIQAVLASTNVLANNLVGLGVNAKEAMGFLHDFADEAGINLVSGLKALQKQGLEGAITSVDVMSTSVEGLVEIFKDDLPKGLDITAITLEHVSEGLHGVVLNSRSAIEDIEKMILKAQVLQQGFAQGFERAIDQHLLTRRAMLDYLDLDTYESAIANADTPVIAQLVGGVAQKGKQFQLSMAQSVQQNLRSDLLEKAQERVEESPAWSTLVNGAASAGEIPGLLADIWKMANAEMNKALLPIELMDDYFASMAENAEQVGVNLGDIASIADTIARGALQQAFSSLAVSAEEAEANRRAAEEQEFQRQQRLRVLDTSIDQARLFGDVIREAELEMERQTLLAVQQNQEAAQSVSELFTAGIKEGLREAVINGIIEALVQSAVIQTALLPVLGAIQEMADATLLGSPRQMQLARLHFERAVAETGGDLDRLGPLFEYIGRTLGGVDIFTDPSTLLAAPGTTDITQGLDGGSAYGAAMGGGSPIIVNITGNYIGDQATADYLARQVGDTMLRQVKLNDQMG